MLPRTVPNRLVLSELEIGRSSSVIPYVVWQSVVGSIRHRNRRRNPSVAFINRSIESFVITWRDG